MHSLALLSVGFAVGVIYAALWVPSSAPPLVAFLGLLGIVLGERGFTYLLRLR